LIRSSYPTSLRIWQRSRFDTLVWLDQGKIDGDTIVVMDSFALPVEGGWVGALPWAALCSHALAVLLPQPHTLVCEVRQFMFPSHD
jgi:hypothetical protein